MIGAFVAGELVFVKELGVGMAAAIVFDVTLVRALLVPALMKLLGRRAWWAPKALGGTLRAPAPDGAEPTAPAAPGADPP